ncbi:MAG: hypothetical protein CME06_09395 [Gemmatimonadetes bacterium]|nr:hypothetical protein [Gemmatimonadota bacterium]
MVLLGIALLVLFFPGERVREAAVARISERLGRPVSIGEVSLGVLGGPRVRLEDVSVGDVAVVGAPRIEVATVALEVALGPLLRRELAVRAVAIEEPWVEVVLGSPGAEDDVAGTNDVEGAEEGASAEEGEMATPTALAFVVDELRIEGGRVSLREVDGEPVAELRGLSEELRASLSPEGELAIEGTTLVEEVELWTPAGRLGQGLELRLRKALRYDLAAELLRIDELTLDIGSLPVAVRGRVAGVLGESPLAELAFEGGPAEIDDIVGLLPAELFPVAGDLRSSGRARLEGRLRSGEHGRGEGLDYEASFVLEEGRVRYGADLPPIEGIEIAATIDPERVGITRLRARAGRSRISCEGEIGDWAGTARVRAEVEAKLALGELGALHPAAAELGLRGDAAIELAIEGVATEPEELDVEGSATVKGVGFRHAKLPGAPRELSGSFAFTRERLRVDGLSFALLESDLALAGVVENPLAIADTSGGSGRARIEAKLTSRVLDLDALFPPDPEKPKGLEPLPPIDGRIEVEIGRLVSSEIESRDVVATLLLKGGRVRIPRADLRAFGGDVRARGAIDLRDPKRPSYEMTATMKGVRAGELASASASFEKFGGVARAVSGDLDAEIGATGTLDDTLGIELTNLTGEGALNFSRFGIEGHPAQEPLARFLSTPGLTSLTAPALRQKVRIDRGMLSLEGLALSAGGAKLVGGGTVSIDGMLNLAFDVELPAGTMGALEGRLPSALTGLLGGDTPIALPILITGASASPKISFDESKVAAVAREAARTRVEEEGARLKEEGLEMGLEKGLESLKGLFGGKKKRKRVDD